MSESAHASVARLAGKGGRYHHGRLRGALIVAAAQILEAEGEAGLTLRALADRAGVSRTAPYRHFADKSALLAALAREGFVALGRELDRAGTGGSDRLSSMAEAYRGFARRHGEVFRLMFIDPSIDPAVRQDGVAAISGRFEAARGTASSASLVAVHALVHGVSLMPLHDEVAEGALAAGIAALTG